MMTIEELKQEMMNAMHNEELEDNFLFRVNNDEDDMLVKLFAYGDLSIETIYSFYINKDEDGLRKEINRVYMNS